MTDPASDLMNFGQRLMFRRAGSHHRDVFTDSKLSPTVGDHIESGSRLRTISRVERSNLPGQLVAIVHAR